MLLGAAKVCITPPVGTWMGGYASRTKPCSSISEDIFVRVHVHAFPQTNTAVIYIYADIAHWDNAVVQNLRKILSSKYEVPVENLVFAASHNHSGPIVGHDELLLPPAKEDEEYTEFVKEKVVEAVGTAFAEQIEVRLIRYSGTSDLNVFRRVSKKGVIYMEPNYRAAADKNFVVLAMEDAQGQLRGLMLHYPCHANVANGYDVHPDYPGIALRILDDRYPQCISMFIQGCTGDLRPNSVCGDSFVPAKYEQVAGFAQSFVRDCMEALQGDPIVIEEQAAVERVNIWLPEENVKSDEELRSLCRGESLFERVWAEGVLQKGNKPGEYMEIQKIVYGKGFTLYTMNAEVVQRYAEYIRQLDPDAICGTYINGMIGYISDAQEIVEGGYEPVDSAPYFLLSGTYSVEIDRIIRQALFNLNNK